MGNRNVYKPCAKCGELIDRRKKNGLCVPCGVRHCSCGVTLGPKNASGKCRICLLRSLQNDPAFRAARVAGIRRKWEDPEYREAACKRAQRLGQKSATDPEITARRIAFGKWVYANVLSRPDVRAKNIAAVRASGPRQSATKLAWCPEEMRSRYRYLIRTKRLLAAQAREIVLREYADQEAVRAGYLDEALGHLRRLAMVMRCDPDGRINPTGSHWRYGSAVLSAGEIVARAKAKGWLPRWNIAA